MRAYTYRNAKEKSRKADAVKRVIASFTAVFAVLARTAFAADAVRTVSEGRISIGSRLDGAAEGSDVTITVVKSGTDWLDKDEMKNADQSAVVYVDKTAAGENGSYGFVFELESAGEYNVFIGGADRTEPETFTLFFTKESESKAATAEIMNAADADTVFGVLNRENSAVTLRLYNPVFNTLKNDAKQPLRLIAQYVYDCLKAGTVSEEELPGIIYKAAAVCIVNGDTQLAFDSIDGYTDIMQLDETGLDKYYDKELSAEYTKRLAKDKHSSVSSFNDSLFDAILLTNIRYGDNKTVLKEMLTELSDRLGINGTDVTDSLADEIIGRDFADSAALTGFVKGFNTKPAPDGGGVSGGGKGGGKGGGSGSGGSVGSAVIADKYTNTQTDTSERVIFSDLGDYKWAEEYIQALFEKGIVKGKGQGKFCPGDSITREEFVKMITEAYSLNVVGTDMAFDDVDENDWFFPYVKSAYYAGIVKGVTETHFGAGQPITRQELAVIADRASYIAGVELEDKVPANTFTDASEIDAYAVSSVEKLQRAGILNGDENGCVNPKAAACRAETAKIIYLLCAAAER